MKIFIRADGGKEIGLGHVMRMLVLAKELQKNNEILFICKDNLSDKFEAGIKIIEENKFPIIKILESDYINKIIDIQDKYNADLLLTDSYDVNEEYFATLNPYFRITGYMDDVNKCKMDVDFIINQNINAEELEYSDNVRRDTKLFLGLKYCLLREEFRKACKSKNISENVNDILLTLGGMDNDRNTLRILKIIKERNKNIHVVIGSAFNRELVKELYEFADLNNNIHLYENANMSNLMLKCDVAISACGSTLYELCAMKVPAIGIIIAENQKNVANKMKEKLLVLDCFHVENIDNVDFASVLNQLIEDNVLRKNIVKNQSETVNINGVENLAMQINKFNSL